MNARRRLGVLLGGVLVVSVAFWAVCLRMPGASRGAAGEGDAELEGELRAHVIALAGTRAQRNVGNPSRYAEARGYVEDALQKAGYEPERQDYRVGEVGCSNLVATLRGATHETVVIGAHYDAASGTPGADDNASGTAALLALARRLASDRPERTLRFVAFANEEPPHFQTGDMGSVVYAHSLAERGETVVAMLSLESIGYYSDAEGSQRYPPPLSAFYPSRGDFVAFVGNVQSRALVREALSAFREAEAFPSQGAALPALLPGVGWSDQWAFWQAGYPGVMVTDTAPFRNPHYHASSDTPETLDYDRLARVTRGLVSVVRRLARSSPGS